MGHFQSLGCHAEHLFADLIGGHPRGRPPDHQTARAIVAKAVRTLLGISLNDPYVVERYSEGIRDDLSDTCFITR